MKDLIKGDSDWHDTINQNFEEVGVSLSDEAQKISQLSNSNLLINPDFRVWQRGTSFNGNTGVMYTADRWRIAGDTAPKIEKTSSGVKITSVNIGTWTNFAQVIEDDIVEKLVGRVVTLTFKTNGLTNGVNQLWCGGQFSGSTFYHCNGFMSSVTSDTFSITFIVSKATTKTEFGFQIKSDVAGRSVELLWAKLEIGSVATPFSPRLYTEELALCQRYYEQVFFSTRLVTDMSQVNQGIEINVPLKVKKRVPPTQVITKYTCESGTANINIYNDHTQDLFCAFLTQNVNTNLGKGCRITYEGISDAEIY